MKKLPTIRSNRLVRALQRAGFTVVRQSGSHAILKHSDGRFTNIPMHARDIPAGTLRAILHQTGMTVEEIRDLL